MSAATLSVDNPVCAKFIFYAAVVLLKTTLMSLWTSRHRIAKNVHTSPEDYRMTGSKPSVSLDPHVERVRRCHLNDLENVLPFVLIGLLFVLVGPEYSYAVLLFRLFAGSRILHTLVYLNEVPQPARALCFGAGQVVMGLMIWEIFSKTSF